MHERIAILDFGSQYTPLIARRIRELGVLAEILPHDAPAAAVAAAGTRGVILSGGPDSAYAPGAPMPDPAVLALPLPLLGVCYGMQLLHHAAGGRVVADGVREYGRAEVAVQAPGALLAGLGPVEPVWMSHGDRLDGTAGGYVATAATGDQVIAAMEDAAAQRYGVQFHPEVTHTPGGRRLLENFVFGICGAQGGWSVADYMDARAAEVRAQVGDAPVLVLVSGGVDSTVCAAMLAKVLGPGQIYPVHIDSGLMRAGESAAVAAALRAAGLTNLHVVEAQDAFLTALRGETDPEAKRRIIGDAFIQAQDTAVAALGLDPARTFLAQGTLYTDLIESGASGARTATIKTHHNVGTPLVKALRAAGRVVEPVGGLFKDEVRELGLLLGLPRELVSRHPFPGPGLGIRVLGEVTPARVATLRAADAIYLDELRQAGLHDQIWQAFAVLLPVRAVGVQGDGRTYGEVVALRAVESVDGMTADFYPVPFEVLGRVARRIANEIPGINRVAFDVTSKPPATIEWE